MSDAIALRVRMETSRTEDGKTVHTASLEELPGVVAEGETERAALSELYALTEDLWRRLGPDVLGIQTQAVERWSWKVSTEVEEETVDFDPYKPEAGSPARASWKDVDPAVPA